MTFLRIFVDGYSLLHAWEELAPGKPRHSAAARAALIRVIEQYQDTIGTPVTICFDGSGAPRGTPKVASRPEMEILFSGPGQTADGIIERAVARLVGQGGVLVVTDDRAERETVISLGGTACACINFVQDVRSALQELQRDLLRHNMKERDRFRKRQPW